MNKYKWIQLSAGVSSLWVPGVPWHTQILADQLTLFQPGETDYEHLITTGTPGFSELQNFRRLWSENRFVKIRFLCMVSNQEQFVIKSALVW